MLELSTKRPSIEVRLDGEVRSLPVTLTALEMTALAKVNDAGTGAEKAEAFTRWFVEFASVYLGDGVSMLGEDGFQALMGAWKDARLENGEPDMGER